MVDWVNGCILEVFSNLNAVQYIDTKKGDR